MDIIYREQTMDALDELCDRVCQYSKEQRDVMCGACPLGDAFDVIDNMPSAEKTGHWENGENNIGMKRYVCSICGKGQPYLRFNYCPNCGARMED